MATKVEVLFTPAEIAALAQRDLAHATCVVFDVLRATSVFVTALANGAESILPVTEIAGALAARKLDPGALLAGEREGLRLTARDAGGVDFDLGNSPREFTQAQVSGRRIISTTTNGTRALRAAAGAGRVLAASFLNLHATAAHLRELAPPEIIIVCAGTGEAMALEDVLAAGALGLALVALGLKCDATDSAQAAMGLFRDAESRLAAVIADSCNGRRLLGIPELQADVAFCARRDVESLVVEMNRDGRLVRAGGQQFRE